MKSLAKSRFERAHIMKQRGVVLFFALIALLAMSLAAVALIRSVDTSTMIAGNLAFRQAATTSGDAGIESAIAWLAATQTANTGVNVFSDTAHPFNNTGGTGAFLNPGYYSNADTALNLTAATWNGVASWDCDANSNNNCFYVGADGSGNEIRYVIQRMCRNADVAINTAMCLFSGVPPSNRAKNTPMASGQCEGPGCPVAGQTPQIRITTRTTGPNNTISYLQAFVY